MRLNTTMTGEPSTVTVSDSGAELLEGVQVQKAWCPTEP